MMDRGIRREDVLESAESYEIIEEYPNDKYLPSYLVFARTAGKDVFHLLFAVDTMNDCVRVVTVYWPNRLKWDSSLKVRIRP